MFRYFLGLGSNIDPATNLGRALEMLAMIASPIMVSRVVETAPFGIATTRPFLNAVAYLKAEDDDRALKNRLDAIESALGRDRADPYRSRKDRTIDIDILFRLPARANRIPEASELPPYHRASFLELLPMLGMHNLASRPARNVRSIVCAQEVAGTVPFEVSHTPRSARIELRPRRAALITGAAARLGKQVALMLAERGYDIALHYNTSRDAAEQTAEELHSRSARCELFQQDLAHGEDLASFFSKVVCRLPHLEVLVNNASCYDSGCVADTTPEMLERQWAVNYRAPFLLMKAFRAHLDHGSIINIADNKIAFNQFQYVAYLSSKKALAELTKMAALEFAPGIRVNAIAPGVVLPGSSRTDRYLEWRRAGIPVNQLGAPEDVCRAIASVLENRFMNGQILFVDGGESINLIGRHALGFEREDAAD